MTPDERKEIEAAASKIQAIQAEHEGRCVLCKWFLGHRFIRSPGIASGQCCRHAPVTGRVENHLGSGVTHTTFPAVRASDRCGDYELMPVSELADQIEKERP